MAMHTTTTPATVAAAAWAKPTGTPASVGGPTTAPSVKKTLADIQREEEQRKQKAKETAHQAGAPSPAVKSYANLASKVGPATPLHQHATLAAVAAAAAHSSSQQPGAPSMAAAAGGGGWSTVGANGKVKMPPTGPAASRSVSAAGGARPPTAGAGAVKQGKPAAVAAPSAGASDWSAFDEAQEDFKKSVAAQLRKGITESMDSKRGDFLVMCVLRT
jgi:PERQ amino acid-rich with GYF domain-containing protein